jgi:hypothetical protein
MSHKRRRCVTESSGDSIELVFGAWFRISQATYGTVNLPAVLVCRPAAEAAGISLLVGAGLASILWSGSGADEAAGSLAQRQVLSSLGCGNYYLSWSGIVINVLWAERSYSKDNYGSQLSSNIIVLIVVFLIIFLLFIGIVRVVNLKVIFGCVAVVLGWPAMLYVLYCRRNDLIGRVSDLRISRNKLIYKNIFNYSVNVDSVRSIKIESVRGFPRVVVELISGESKIFPGKFFELSGVAEGVIFEGGELKEGLG